MIEKKSLAEIVAEKLKAQILRGDYVLHEKLPTEPEMMKYFGVGRSSIREAIRIMSNSGFLRVQQGVGTFVSDTQGTESFTHKLENADIHLLIEVREFLELKIAEKAAIHRSDADLMEMEKYLKMRKYFAKKGEVKACIQADIDFHLSISAACGNSILHDIYKSASSYVLRWFFEQYDNTDIFAQTQATHEQLLAAIKSADAKKAAKMNAKIIGRV